MQFSVKLSGSLAWQVAARMYTMHMVFKMKLSAFNQLVTLIVITLPPHSTPKYLRFQGTPTKFFLI